MTALRPKSIGFRALIATALILLITPAVQAGSVKDRMAARNPQIVQLKGKGLVGENNQGYLELRGSDRADAALVKAENKDRRLVYKAIAKKTGGTAEQVGRQVAAKRVSKAGRGEWLQKPGGEWYRK
ncbi:MAG: YdbL family protein [Desulfosarcina sp.]|nr:YdbL family protein [Desulfobacterales bacterium]